MQRDGLHLIFDADDTLWENNVHFERAIEEFFDFLDHSSLSRVEARAVLDEIEAASFGTGGFGAQAFTRNLQRCYERLAERQICQEDLAVVMGFGERILAMPITLIEGVEETLTLLAARHDLTLLTKGHDEEQRRKIERSGIAHYFRHAEVVPTKNAAAYHALVERLELAPARTWMIGNSPKSDINPALAAGLNAVFIPHPATWRLEHQELDGNAGPGELLVLERFRDLGRHFLEG
jgi:putative hydrolase of the HAD superfamily